MLKPLLPSIPQKELLIEGRFYNVYEQVSLYDFSKQTVLVMQLANYNKKHHIKTFPKIKDIALKDKAIHLYIEDILAKSHDYIEQHYVGDRFVKIDSLPKPIVQKTTNNGLDYITISYRVKRSPEDITTSITSKNATKLVGRLGTVSQDDIDLRVSEVEEHQRVTLENFKTYLVAKRAAFRQQVEKEIAERDSMSS